MPIPLLALIGWGLTAISAYEAASTGYELWEEHDAFKKGLENAKKEANEIIRLIKEEIAKNIESQDEMLMIVGAAAADGHMQSHQTKEAIGRGGNNQVIATAIKQKIPFRPAISLACRAADSMPVMSLRKKRGVTVKDVVSAKKTLLKEIAGLTIEQLADVNIEDFYVVHLKQLALSLLIEYMDSALDWQSPLKAEVCFGPPPHYADHPVEGATQLKRVGKISPFWPAPHRRKGSIAADIMITERRKKKPDKSNIFAIVEIKFPNDRIEQKQFDQYNSLLILAAKVKTAQSPTTLDSKAVSKGGDLSLFRYPEDVADFGAHPDRSKESKPGGNSGGKKRN